VANGRAVNSDMYRIPDSFPQSVLAQRSLFFKTSSRA